MSAEPLLLTERLELRVPQASDLAGLIEVVAAEETRRYLGPAQPDQKSKFERLLRNAGSWRLYGYGNFTLHLRGAEAIVGTCGVFHSWRGLGQGMDDVPEAGWILHKDHWGKGLAGEAMRAVLSWFDRTHRAPRIVCMIEEGNLASDRLAHSLGFAPYGREIFEDAEVVLYERRVTPSP